MYNAYIYIHIVIAHWSYQNAINTILFLVFCKQMYADYEIKFNDIGYYSIFLLLSVYKLKSV